MTIWYYVQSLFAIGSWFFFRSKWKVTGKAILLLTLPLSTIRQNHRQKTMWCSVLPSFLLLLVHVLEYGAAVQAYVWPVSVFRLAFERVPFPRSKTLIFHLGSVKNLNLNSQPDVFGGVTTTQRCLIIQPLINFVVCTKLLQKKEFKSADMTQLLTLPKKLW